MSEMLRHNLKFPFPTSHDGNPARRCDRFGDEHSRGRYIIWTELLPTDNFPRTKIAKLFREEKIEKLNWNDVRTSLKDDPKCDIDNKKVVARMRARIVKAYAKLGINHVDACNMTQISPEVEMCGWVAGSPETNERILVNPYFATKAGYTRLAWMLRRENIHRAICRGRKHLKNKQLLNLVADICANRVLAATTSGKPSKSWEKFIKWCYPDKGKETVMALCNSTLKESEVDRLERINPRLAELWNQVYQKEVGEIVVGKRILKNGKVKEKKKKVDGMLAFAFKTMNPDELYFALKSLLTDKDKDAMQPASEGGMNPFGEQDKEVDHKGQMYDVHDNAANAASPRSKRIEEAIRRDLVPKRKRYGIDWRNFSDTRTDFWDGFMIKPEDLQNDDLAAYARRIKTRKILDDVTGRVVRAHVNDVSWDVYPDQLSEEGMMLVAIGMEPPHFPFYQNLDGAQGRRKVVAFFDLSPSMMPFVPYMCKICEKVEDVMDVRFAVSSKGEGGLYTFAGSIQEIDRKQFDLLKQGRLEMGQSTSYNEVVEFCNQMPDEDVDAVICFTDGESAVNHENIRAFNKRAKQMYAIYFSPYSPSNRKAKIESDLDLLKGEAHTLTLPPTDDFGK